LNLGSSAEGRLARRQALPFVYVGAAGIAVNASSPDNLGALDSWPFLTGATLAVLGIVFMTVWARELPPRIRPLPALGGMVSAALIAAATGGGKSDAIALVLLALIWFGYAAVGRQVVVGAAAFAVTLSAVSYFDAPDASRLRNWDHVATILLVGMGLLYGVSRIARDRRELTAKLEDSARTDPLTGLLNRRGFEEGAAAALARAKRARETVGLLMLDLAGFKHLNDGRGHRAGDELLVRVADAWRASLRAGDLLGRAGGDEFLVLLVDTDRARAGEVADRLRERTPSAVSCSAGVALSRAEDADLDRLVTAADDALYAAKATGRDRVVFSSGSTLDAAESRRIAAVAVPAAEDRTTPGDPSSFDRLLGDAGVMRLTALGDRFVSIAPEVEHVLGWHPEELLAATFAELIHPEDRDAALAEAARVELEGAAVHGFEARLRRRDGRYRRLRFHAVSDGALWYAVALDLGDAGGALNEPAAAA
jgi:diguanylate cyclase (GGDEF)-like protein/PAS domain S-box-containing protein